MSSPDNHNQQPYDPRWPPRQRHDTADSSHQGQPYDVQPPPRNSPNSNQRQLYNVQQPARNASSRQPSDAGGGNHYGQQRTATAHGVDLTGQVRILRFPGQQYQWYISTGAFTDVFQGEYRQVMAPGMVESQPIHVAVKIFRSTSDDQQQRDDVSRRLIRESRVWLRLNHPNIQPYLGHCSDLGLSVALISPLCGNSTVIRYITNNPSANKLQLVKEIATGLAYLHSQNVIHGDLQCNNVLVNEAGQAVLADFGRAKVIGEEGYSTQLLAGSAAYMAPELLSPTDADVDELFSKKSDIYAFGMLCFKIFTNQEPFAYYNVRRDMQLFGLIQQGKRPVFTSDVRDQISQRMWRIMEACWTTAPASRPSAEQIVQRMP